MRSIFAKIITIDTPQLAREGAIWSVYCVFEVWFMYYRYDHSADGNIMKNWCAL